MDPEDSIYNPVWALRIHSHAFWSLWGPRDVSEGNGMCFERPSWPLSSEGSLACHTYCVYNGRMRGPVPLTPIAEHLAVELSLPVLTT